MSTESLKHKITGIIASGHIACSSPTRSSQVSPKSTYADRRRTGKQESALQGTIYTTHMRFCQNQERSREHRPFVRRFKYCLQPIRNRVSAPTKCFFLFPDLFSKRSCGFVQPVCVRARGEGIFLTQSVQAKTRPEKQSGLLGGEGHPSVWPFATRQRHAEINLHSDLVV